MLLKPAPTLLSWWIEYTPNNRGAPATRALNATRRKVLVSNSVNLHHKKCMTSTQPLTQSTNPTIKARGYAALAVHAPLAPYEFERRALGQHDVAIDTQILRHLPLRYPSGSR